MPELDLRGAKVVGGAEPQPPTPPTGGPSAPLDLRGAKVVAVGPAIPLAQPPNLPVREIAQGPPSVGAAVAQGARREIEQGTQAFDLQRRQVESGIATSEAQRKRWETETEREKAYTEAYAKMNKALEEYQALKDDPRADPAKLSRAQDKLENAQRTFYGRDVTGRSKLPVRFREILLANGIQDPDNIQPFEYPAYQVALQQFQKLTNLPMARFDLSRIRTDLSKQRFSLTLKKALGTDRPTDSKAMLRAFKTADSFARSQIGQAIRNEKPIDQAEVDAIVGTVYRSIYDENLRPIYPDLPDLGEDSPKNNMRAREIMQQRIISIAAGKLGEGAPTSRQYGEKVGVPSGEKPLVDILADEYGVPKKE